MEPREPTEPSETNWAAGQASRTAAAPKSLGDCFDEAGQLMLIAMDLKEPHDAAIADEFNHVVGGPLMGFVASRLLGCGANQRQWSEQANNAYLDCFTQLSDALVQFQRNLADDGRDVRGFSGDELSRDALGQQADEVIRAIGKRLEGWAKAMGPARHGVGREE